MKLTENSLEAAVGEEADTISDVYEPFLVQEGFLERTKQGRVATRKARQHLDLKNKSDGDLF